MTSLDGGAFIIPSRISPRRSRAIVELPDPYLESGAAKALGVGFVMSLEGGSIRARLGCARRSGSRCGMERRSSSSSRKQSDTSIRTHSAETICQVLEDIVRTSQGDEVPFTWVERQVR